MRRLATLMGLRVHLRSRVGRGSVFTLDGLTAWVGAAPRTAPIAAHAETSLAGVTVAVIEDDTDVLEAMRTLLRSWGCEVLAGVDAPSLIAQRPSAPPDALIADVRLGAGRDGPREVRALQARWGGAVPALFVTGETAPERVQALTRDGLAWLAKPVAPRQLHRWLWQTFAGSSAAAPAPSTEEVAR